MSDSKNVEFRGNSILCKIYMDNANIKTVSYKDKFLSFRAESVFYFFF